MEAEALLKMLIDLHDKHGAEMFVKNIVIDDDSSTKALVRHNSKVAKKGRLPSFIPEPNWLADPSNRIKVVARKIYALASLPPPPIRLH